MKKDTCENRISEALDRRLEQYNPNFESMDIEELEQWAANYGAEVSKIDPGDEDEREEDLRELCREQFQDNVASDILSIEKTTVYTVLLSWGGPSDEFEFHYQAGELMETYYIFKDWFDGARQKVDETVGEELAQVFCIGPEFE